MDFDFLANLSWREALIAIVALLAAYVVVVFVRLHRIKQGKPDLSVPEQLAARSALAAYAAEQQPAPPEVAPATAPELLSAPSEFAFPWNEPPEEVQAQQRIDALEREQTQLRKEVGSLRAEVLVLREELQRNQVQLAQNVVSPLYSDAMQMAMQGYDAVSISEHCGIARAEADLVVALVRNRSDGN